MLPNQERTAPDRAVSMLMLVYQLVIAGIILAATVAGGRRGSGFRRASRSSGPSG